MIKRLRSIKLGTKVLVATAVTVVIVVGANFALFFGEHKSAVEEALVAKGSMFTALAEEGQRKTYETLLADETQELFMDPEVLHSGWVAARKAAEREGIEFLVTANDAANPQNDPSRDEERGAFRAELYDKLLAQVAAGGSPDIVELNRDTNTLHYQRAIPLFSECTACHDGVKGVELAGDEVHGAYELLLPLDAVDAGVASFFKTSLTLTVLLTVVALLGFRWFYRRQVARPLQSITSAAGRIAQGDIDLRIDHENDDEIGLLASHFNELIEYIQQVAQHADALRRGDLSRTIVPRSEKDLLSQNFQSAAETLRAMIGKTRQIVEAARNGELHQENDEQLYEGAYRELLEVMDGLLDAVRAPIEEASSVLEGVSKRDLTQPMTGQYSGRFAVIRDSINAAIRNLDGSLFQVSGAADQVASAARQISTGSQGVAQTTAEMAASLEEVSSSLHELSAGSNANASGAANGRELAKQSNEATEAGVSTVGELTEAIGQIKTSADETAKIVSVIDGIAFQTNLLALNAAVEAARAGESGRGFAVVAEEVRNLALRSADAAKKSSEMIKQSIEKAERGVHLSAEVSSRLDDIRKHADALTSVMGEIATASDRQRDEVQQVTSAVETMNIATQQNAAHAEETAGSTEHLHSQASRLRELVAEFSVSENSSLDGSVGPE